MDGITILSQTEILNATANYDLAFVIACIVFFFLCILFGALLDWEGIAILPSVMFAVLTFAIVAGVTSQTTNTGRNKYKVLIADNVDFKQVYAKYEIVGTEGQIYILEDKENPDK